MLLEQKVQTEVPGSLPAVLNACRHISLPFCIVNFILGRMILISHVKCIQMH